MKTVCTRELMLIHAVNPLATDNARYQDEMSDSEMHFHETPTIRPSHLFMSQRV